MGLEFSFKSFEEFEREIQTIDEAASDSVRLSNGERLTKDEIIDKLSSLAGSTMKLPALHKKIDDIFGFELKGSAIKKMVTLGAIENPSRGIYSVAKGSSDKSKSDEEIINNAEIGNGKATTLSKVLDTKVKKYKVPPSSKSNKFGDFTQRVMLNMINKTNGAEKGSLLLTGDPGTGKTSSIQQFAMLLGIGIITIEAPHTSEDAIISVPYLYKKGNEEEEKVQNFEQQGEGFKVVNAESALISDLKRTKLLTDAAWDQSIKNNKQLVMLKEKYKKPITKLRNRIAHILFIDEFYRSGSTRIQNLLRTILNGKIGTTKIPDNVYIIFASNMDNSDSSLDDIPLNHQFTAVEFDAITKDDFMTYIANKFTDEDSTTKISEDVYNKFIDVLSDDDLGGKDVTTQIRISPRRWEEIIKYINNGIPPSNRKAAEALVQFIYTNMRDYKEGTHSSLTAKYAQLVKDLIKENSSFDVDNVGEPRADEWQNLLENQIKAKMALGADRKYVATLSGLPGTGKTSAIRNLSEKLGVKVIEIDCSVLDSEAVVGLTTPTKNEDGTITTEFTEPPLYSQIMSEYDKDLEVPGSQYTHILFLDEITRTTKRVMNSIRMLMLEKKVNSGYKLPDNIMIMSAMNPVDVGAEELSDHLVDVMDIIDVEAKESELFDYLRNKKSNLVANEELGFNITDEVINIMQKLIDTLKSDMDTDSNKISGNSSKFFWKWDNNIIYISPREMDDMISGSIGEVVSYLIDFQDFDPKNNYDEADYIEFIEMIRLKVVEKFSGLLSFIGKDKHDKSEEAMDQLFMFVEQEVYRASFSEIMSIKSENITSISSMAEQVNYDFSSMIDYPETGTLIESYFESVEPEEIQNNVGVVIDEILATRSESPTQFMDALGGFYKVLKMVDFSKYSGKISANISEIIIQRAMKPYANNLKELVLNSKATFKDEIESNQFYDEFKELETKFLGTRNFFI